MSVSQQQQQKKIFQQLLQYNRETLPSLRSGGMESICPVIPENVIVRVDSNRGLVAGKTYAHRRMILKMILSGRLKAIIDGLNFYMEPGDSVLFFPFQFHAAIDLNPDDRHRFIAVSFLVPENNPSVFLPLKNHIFKLSTEELVSLKEITEAFYKTGTTTHSQALLKLSSILLRQVEQVSQKTLQQPCIEDHCAKICNYIREHFTQKLSLKSLACEFGVSTETIRKMFRSSFPGLTPGKLIGQLQLQSAVELLECTDAPIRDIAIRCGFSDPFVFSKKFKRVTGLSPREHRLEIRRQKQKRNIRIAEESGLAAASPPKSETEPTPERKEAGEASAKQTAKAHSKNPNQR